MGTELFVYMFVGWLVLGIGLAMILKGQVEIERDIRELKQQGYWDGSTVKILRDEANKHEK